MLASLAGLLFGLLPFALSQRSASVFAAGLSLAGASWAAGAVLGFLFGIPRTSGDFGASRVSVEEAESGARGSNQLLPNTNLVEVSDWLTKIIVGLGLVSLGEVPGLVREVTKFFRPGLGDQPASESLAAGILVGYVALGFLTWYLHTRLHLQQAFAQADRDLQEDFNRSQKDAIVAKNRGVEGEATATKELEQFAAQYDQTRQSMRRGYERTSRMETIMSEMRKLAVAAEPSLPKLASSESPGKRLSAIAILQVRPSVEWLDWLADRFDEEKPFVQYHAGLALLSAAKELSDREAVRGTVLAAKRRTSAAMGTDRWKMLEAAERELGEE